MPEHEVRQGACMASIATRYGRDAKTLWNHAQNARRKQKRKDPHVLLPGDVVFIPDKELRETTAATGRRYQCRVKSAQPRSDLFAPLLGESFGERPCDRRRLERRAPV